MSLAATNLSRPDGRRALALAAVIAGGLALDQLVAWGQTVVDVVVWAAFVRWLWLADRTGRVLLVACVAIAAVGECVLSLVWGLYDYRLGSVPWFVPPGHALLLMLGMLVAARLPDRVTWIVPLAAAPIVAWQAIVGVDRLGVLLFAVLLLAMWRGRARKLYAVMFALSLAMELYGTWLGNWRWRAEAPWIGLSAGNPPLTAGAFYCVLDALVMAVLLLLRGSRRVERGRDPADLAA